MYTYMYACMYVLTWACVQRSEDSFWELVLFYLVEVGYLLSPPSYVLQAGWLLRFQAIPLSLLS